METTVNISYESDVPTDYCDKCGAKIKHNVLVISIPDIGIIHYWCTKDAELFAKKILKVLDTHKLEEFA